MHTSDHGKGPGHETRDVRIKAIAWLGVAILLVTLAAGAGMVGLFDLFDAREAGKTRLPVSMVRPEAAQQPPEPRLQGQPVRDLAALRAEEDKALTTYGWVDPAAGVVRIPIERAMDRVLERGLPARAPEARP